jgi:hypothetical protein
MKDKIIKELKKLKIEFVQTGDYSGYHQIANMEEVAEKLIKLFEKEKYESYMKEKYGITEFKVPVIIKDPKQK